MFTSQALATADFTSTVSPAPAPAPAAVVIGTLSQAPARAASARASAFNYAGLFAASVVALAFNADVVKQAESGRVSAQFRELSATLGLIVPESKKAFDKFSRDIIGDVVAPFPKAKAKSSKYCEALALIRETMGLDTVKNGWFTEPKPAAAKAEKPAYVPSGAVSAIVAKLAGLDNAALQYIIKAAQAQKV